MLELQSFKAANRNTTDFLELHDQIKIFSTEWREYRQAKANNHTLFAANSNTTNEDATPNTSTLLYKS